MKRILASLLFLLGVLSAVRAQNPTPRDTMTFAVMGNSISTYYDFLPSGYAVYYGQSLEKKYGIQSSDTWWGQLSRLSGMTFLTNSSWSGSRVACDALNSISPFVSTARVTSVGRAGVPDAILIAGGTNDWNVGKVPLGEYREAGPFNDSITFRGAYAMLLDRLHRKYPDMKLICLSIFPRGNSWTDKNAQGWTLADANASIKAIAKQFGGYYVDCTSVAFSSNWGNYTIDRLHPTTAGHLLLAQCIRRSLVTQGVITTALKRSDEVSEATPLLDLSFDADGIRNTGSFQTTVGARGTATTIYDSEHDVWYGCTKATNRDFFYALYDANSELANAFNGNLTWEALVRLDGLADSKNEIDRTAFFSTEQDGGWSFYNSGTASAFSYTHESGIKSCVKNLSGDSIMVAGRFYHLVVTMDRTSHTMRYYVNGQLVTTGTRMGTDMRLPNCGSTKRKRNMWVSLGGRPAAGSYISGNEAGTASTFVFARIYDGALTQKAAKALYTDEVKAIAEPVRPASSLLLDCDFRSTGAVNHAASYVHRPVETVGNVAFTWNSEGGFYEAQFDGTKANFLKYNFGDSPAMMSQLGDAYSVEIYCRNSSALPSASTRPFSFPNGYGPGLQMNNKGNIAYTTTTVGEKTDGTHAKTQWTWLDAGALTTDYTHYVIAYDRLSNISRFIVNGEEKATRSLSAKECSVFDWTPGEWLAIGGDAYGQYASTNAVGLYPYVGSIAYIRVWNRALMTDECLDILQQLKQKSVIITTGSNGYAAVCVPFAFEVPAGMTAYIVSETTSTYAYIKPVAIDGYVIPYGAPIILKADAKQTFTLTPVSDEAAAIALQPDLDGNLLTGDFGRKRLTVGEGYYQNTSGNFLYRPTAAVTLRAFSAWLPSAAKRTTLIYKEVEVDGIGNISAPSPLKEKNTEMYDLNGQRVVQGQPNTIIIQQGKKRLTPQ